MLHSIFHTVDMANDYPVDEDMMEEDSMGEEMLDDGLVDTESLDDDVVDHHGSRTRRQQLKKFYCKDCSKFFTTNKTLRRHIRRIHNKTPDPIPSRSPPVAKIADGSAVCCQDCGIWFSAKKNLLRHIRTSTTHKQRAERRKLPGDLLEVEMPVLDTNDDDILPEELTPDCETLSIKEEGVCEEELDIPEIKMEPSPGSETNKNCVEDIKIDQNDENMDLDSNSSDYKLRNRSQNVSPIAADKCDGGIRKSVDVSGLKKYPCEECGQQFTKKSNVYRHIRRIHHKNVAVPKGKEIPSRTVKEYNAVKAFPCEKCDLKFAKLGDLGRHVQISHNKSPAAVPSSGSGKNNMCDQCSQHFASRSNLLRHIRRQHAATNDQSSTLPRIKLKRPPSVPSAPLPAPDPDVQSVMVLGTHLRLTDYPFLKNMLPASYDYNLRCYSVLSTTKNNPVFKNKCFDATLQFHCFTVAESKYWVSLFEKTNRLSFHCMITQSQENDANSSNLQYKCSVKGCPSLLIITTVGANINRRNMVRVTVRIVHKHNHLWDPPRLDLSQLVEAVIEEQDMADGGSEQISVAPDPTFYVPNPRTVHGSQPPVMTLFFDKGHNSYMSQNTSLTNGASNDSSPGLVIVSSRSKKDEENGSVSGVFDAVGQFKRVCADMAVMIQQDPQYFAEAVQHFEASFDRVCSSKLDLLKALSNFGQEDEVSEASELG